MVQCLLDHAPSGRNNFHVSRIGQGDKKSNEVIE
jgi:hypothetical protein